MGCVRDRWSFPSVEDAGDVAPFVDTRGGFTDASEDDTSRADGVRDTGVCGMGPVNLYRGEGSADDAAGQHHASVQGGASFAAGRFGEGFLFDGAGQYVAIPAAVGNFGAGNFSLVFWMNTTSTAAVSDIIAKRVSCSGGTFFTGEDIRMGGVAGNLFIELWSTAGLFVLQTPMGLRLNDGVWHQVAIVREGSMAHLNVDGSVVASIAFAGSMNDPSDTPTYLGVSRCVAGAPGASLVDGTAWFRGRLDSVAFYARDLSGDELAASAQGFCHE